MPPWRPVVEPGRAPDELRTRGQRTRQRLLHAGTEVFAERGYHAARVDDIVKVARTSHGTFYRYFANKEALFHALTDEIARRLEHLAAALPPFTRGPEGLEALSEWMAQFQDLYSDYGSVLRAWTEAEIVASDVGQLATTVWAAFARSLIERIREAAHDGLDPAVAALALVAMIERTNYYAITGQVATDPATMITTLARVTQSTVFGSTAPR